MDNAKKRRLAREYKERRQSSGIFAVRCRPTGAVWAQGSVDLDAQKNQIWFSLRLGKHPNAALQAAWKEHGEAAFAYEILETLPDDDVSDYARRADLKAMEERWRAELGARRVTG